MVLGTVSLALLVVGGGAALELASGALGAGPRPTLSEAIAHSALHPLSLLLGAVLVLLAARRLQFRLRDVDGSG